MAETFVVIESNLRFGFARLQSEATGQQLHAELYVERPGGDGERLCEGDRVTGRVRGQSLHAPVFVERAAPPEELVGQMEALREALGHFGLEVPLSARELADEHWRSQAAARGLPHASLREALHPQLTLLFDWERAHPFEDETLVPRLVEAVRRHVPEFGVEALSSGGEPTGFRLQPEARELEASLGDWDDPAPRYAGLIQATNAVLASRNAPARWTRLRDDWLFGPPALAELLVRSGLLTGPADA
jgi:hypothetical protein